MRKIAVTAVILISAACLYAQENQRDISYHDMSRPFFFAAPSVEAVWYGRTPPSIGYGFALGSEGNVFIGTASIGLKGIYAVPLAEDDLTTLEVTIFFRIYMPWADTADGFFAQLTYGFALFSWDGRIQLLAESGMISLGVTAGWRFPLGSRFFIEPYIRAGYPYYGGAGLSTGIRF